MLCPFVEKIGSAVKQWNGIKETNTGAGTDNDKKKKEKRMEPV